MFCLNRPIESDIVESWAFITKFGKQYHRRDFKPARIFKSKVQYWIYGEKFDISPCGSYIIIDPDCYGCVRVYYKDGKVSMFGKEQRILVKNTEDGTVEWFYGATAFLHNYPGPAVIRPNGTKEWWILGIKDRIDGPAIEYANGDYEYWRDGKRHRYDGPAVSVANKQYFFENGEFIKCIV